MREKEVFKEQIRGYKKIRTRALDGYVGLSRNNILTVTSNDAEFIKIYGEVHKQGSTKASDSN